jgi:hypothetical protein
MGACLPRYETYLKSIRLYCRAIQLKLEFSAADGDGAYVPSRRIIRVDPELSEASTIAVLLHELGHVLDDTTIKKAKFREVERAYTRLHKAPHRLSPVHSKTIIRTERRAWEYGRVVAKILGIPIGRWYDKTMAGCIKAYKE